MTEEEQREAVIVAARSWLGTPFHDDAEVKGAGIDCAHFLAVCFAEAGLIPPQKIAPYNPTWFLHSDVPIFENYVKRFSHQIEGPPKRADIVLYKLGRLYAHGAIVIDWPTTIIHSFKLFGFVAETSSDEGDLRTRARRFYSYW